MQQPLLHCCHQPAIPQSFASLPHHKLADALNLLCHYCQLAIANSFTLKLPSAVHCNSLCFVTTISGPLPTTFALPHPSATVTK
jgi:hypothetical protein